MTGTTQPDSRSAGSATKPGASAKLAGPPAGVGEEFRVGSRQPLPQAMLPIDTVRRLSRLDPWRATAAVAWSAGLIALLATVGALWSHPLVLLAVIVAMGGAQQSLFVLAHTAAHYRLYERRWLNDLVGRTCGVLAGISMCSYRVLHRLHHNHLYERIDPDMPLIAGYPRGRAYLLRKLAKDAVGLTAWKTYSYFFGLPIQNTETDAQHRPLDDTSPELRAAALRDRWVVAGFHLTAPVAALALGWGWQYLLLWVLPLLTTLQVALRLRAVLEHGAVDDTTTPLKAARTNLAPAWLRWWLFPHQVNYHVEHHLYPSIPHYRMHALHAALREAGALEGAEVLPVWQSLRKVFAEAPPARGA